MRAEAFSYPSDVYDPVYLLRLLYQLPDLVAAAPTPLQPEKQKVANECLELLTDYIDSRYELIFCNKPQPLPTTVSPEPTPEPEAGFGFPGSLEEECKPNLLKKLSSVEQTFCMKREYCHYKPRTGYHHGSGWDHRKRHRH
jgi:hypothetical protein